MTRNSAWCRSTFVSTTLFTGALLTGSATEALAGFSSVNNSHVRRPAREATHEQIFEQVYGGDFIADGVNFSNGAVNVTRMSDDGAGSDEVWSKSQIQSARAIAAFARRKQIFGYFGGESGGSFNKLFAVEGTGGFDVTGQASGATIQDGSVRFGRRENVEKAFSSLASENRDGKDHLVSYSITGADGQQNPIYLLFWEDKWGQRSDFDFNDLVVEVQGASEPLLIPLPPGAWTGLGGLACLGLLAARKRLRGFVR